MMTRIFSMLVLLLLVAACGGGGGSSSSVNPAPSVGGGGGTGGGSAGGSGGSSSGGNFVVPDGLVSGGFGISADSAVTSGVNGVTFDVAGGGTGGFFAGDIQAFSSIVINDVVVDTDSAAFTIEGASGSQSDLKQGQQILLLGDTTASSASEVFYRANIKGPVTALTVVDAALGQVSMQVLGQTVRTDATTAWSDVSVTTLAVNDLLEISGTFDDQGILKATFVERKVSLAEYKVIGLVANLSATQFTLDGLEVDYSSATLSEFENGSIQLGEAVEVKGAAANFTAPNQFTADEVERLQTLLIASSADASIEGFIDEFNSSDDFTIQDVGITTNGTTNFVNGDATSLAAGVKVRVVGTSDSAGRLVATDITILPTNTIRAEGNIEAIDLGAQTISLLGITFAMRDLTQFEDDSAAGVEPLALGDLGVGDEVEIRGFLDGSSIIAVEVEREDAEDRARLQGVVTAEDAAAGTLSILGVEITGQSGITQYEDASDSVITQSQFHDLVEVNQFVKASWDVFSDTSQVVDELSIEVED